MLPVKKPEFQLIDRFRSLAAQRSGVLTGIGDDCAIVHWGVSNTGLVTTDMLLEGVHFDLATATPRQVGRKALGVNLSDIAAMAGRPQYAVVSLGLQRQYDAALVEELFAGMQDLAADFETSIVGGDTNAWEGPLVINVTLIGEPNARGAVLRSGAQPGDWIFVTGDLGGSILGRQFSFMPRVHEAQRLAEHVSLRSMLDVSDGLVADLYHILEESHCGAVLFADRIPVSAAAHQMAGRLESLVAPIVMDDHFSGLNPALGHALSDGEDFELLLTVSPEDGARLLAASPLDCRLSHIGEVIAEPACRLRMASGVEWDLPRMGWNHNVNEAGRATVSQPLD